MLQGFSSATGRPSAAEPPCRKDWPSGGICAFRRRLQDPGVTQVMRLPVLFAFPGILFSLSFVGDVPSPRGTDFFIAMGQPLSCERQVSVAMESSFSLSLQAFSQDPGLFLPPGSLPVLAVSCALSLKPFSVTANPCATASALPSPRAPFCHSRIPLLATARDFFSVTAGLLSANASLFPVTASPFPYHRKFPSLPPRVLSPVTASSLPCHCELLSLSLRAQAKQSRISTVFPQGERGRDCFANVKTSSQ
jgi:hypothetical protein